MVLASDLDGQFEGWLKSIAERSEISAEEVAEKLGFEMIANRERWLPIVGRSLRRDPIDLDEIIRVAKVGGDSRCWSLSDSGPTQIQLNTFLAHRNAALTITELIRDFPSDDLSAIERIDNFISHAVDLGFRRKDGSNEYARAALLCSALLTALYPSRFVDARHSKWLDLAHKLAYDCPIKGDGAYGNKIMWAGGFARDITDTPTFRRYWNGVESLWTISGICWIASDPTLPDEIIKPLEEISYPEGRRLTRLHTIRERNPIVVEEAKRRRFSIDPLLKCEICGFSFRDFYGDFGDGFIEAHHKKPIADLSLGEKTRVEDIALICSNCHSMIHHGDETKTLTMNELKDAVSTSKT